MDKDWRSTHDYCHAGIWFKLCDERWNESNVSIPAFFCTVDCDIDRAVWLFLPYVLHLVEANKVCLRAGTVNYLDFTVVFAVIHHVIYYRVYRSNTNTSGDYEDIFSFKSTFNRESVSDWSAETNLLTNFCVVQPFSYTTTFFD